MVTNSKEYQREYQKEYRRIHPQKQYKKVKKVSKEVKNLHPPKMVEKSVDPEGGNTSKDSSKQREPDTDSKTIDPFVWLSSNHSFQMVIQEFMRKFAPGMKEFGIKVRGNKKVLKNSFSKARQDLMKELKQVLEMRKK